MLFLIILILSFISGFFLPWWVAAIIAFGASLYIGKTPRHAFWSGFAALVIVWVVLALFKSIPNDNLLAKRVATLFQLPNWIFLLAITGLIGGLVGALAALSGVLVKRALAR